MLNQLQLLGIKLFSVSPSEMCDERTASKLANFNSAKRNGLSAQNLKYMAQLHDWWTYGLNAPTYTHTANLHLPAACKEHHQNRHTLGQGIETSGRSSVKRNVCPIVWPYLPIAKYPVPGPTHKVSGENLKDQG